MKAAKALYRLFAVGVLMVLIIAASACTTPQENQVYGIGDVVDVGYDTTMVLSRAEFRGSGLDVSYTIENRGTEDRSYNLWLSLQARDMEGTPLPQLIPCGSNMDGTLHPGDRGTGVICWDRGNAEVVRIHYIVLAFESNIVWEIRE